MNDPRLRNLAKLLVRYSVAVKPGDLVGISLYGSIPQGYPLLNELYHQALDAGGYPHYYLLPSLVEETDYDLYQYANDEQLQHVDRFYRLLAEEFDCDIYFNCEANTRRLSNVDPQRVQTHRRAYTELVGRYFERVAQGSLRWVFALYPTAGFAQDAEMSLAEFEDFAFSAAYADTDDPVARWQEMSANQQRLVDWLAGKQSVTLKGEHVDLSFSIAGRSFINCDGRVNMPDGEIFSGPVEDSVNGWFESTFPAIYDGVDVGQVTLHFENGAVVQARAEKNQGFLDSRLDIDPGARRLGEFGIGTNSRIQRFIKNMLFDEKIAGTIHVALGRGYPETGSQNESAIHWDILCDMRAGGQIFVDDQLIYEAGQFKI